MQDPPIGGSEGLVYMEQRYYDPSMMRFLSVDAVGVIPTDPRTLHRYSYAANNPYRYIDPTGESFWEGVGTFFSEVGSYLSGNGYDGARVAGAFAEGYNNGFGEALVTASADVLILVDVINTPISPGPDVGMAGATILTGKKVAKRHKNSRSYKGDTHVFAVRNPDGSVNKIGESARGTRFRDGSSKRAEEQVRKLNREVGPGHTSEIRKNFPDKDTARTYETKLIERYRRRYGQDTLPGNKSNR